jgi:cytosine/adenosine deaminase-related metal-dependent hydrolase
MLTLRARWVLPIVQPPLEQGWVAVDRGRVIRFGHERRKRPRGGAEEIDLGSAALMPGLVNAHTHLELSYLRNAVAPASRFTDWIREVIRLRREQADPSTSEVVEALVQGIEEARAAGTAVLGDISNTLASVPPLTQSRLAAHVFFELVRFRSSEAEETWPSAMERLREVRSSPRVRVSVAPHAPYSVSTSLLQMIRREVDKRPNGRTSVHLSESEEEIELLLQGTGGWRTLLDELHAWDPTWPAPGCTPVEYLDRLRFLGSDTIVVHGVHVTDADLARLAARHTTLVTCPRSNRYVGAGDPPVARFYRSGVAVAVGTDSLASAPDLNMFGELAALRQLAPEVPAARLLESATRVGARALGFDEYGTIAAGTPAAGLIAVSTPDDTADIEEYLVNGIPSDRIQWPVADVAAGAAPLDAIP